MKRIYVLLAICTPLLFLSCEGDPGPPGPPGINILGNVFEVNIDFTQGNDYRQLVTFPNSIEVFESDVVLVYWLEDVVSDGQGGTLDVWSQLPQTIYLNGGGSFQYTFNHTFLDALIFLQGDVDLSTLGNGFTNDQIFRIAIVPAEFGSADLSMDDLLRNLQLESSEIETLLD